MGWFSRSNSNQDDSASKNSDNDAKYLEDLPPKFDDNVEQAQLNREFEKERKSTTLKEAWHSVKLSDFKQVNQIPCFRQSMLTGGAAAGVIFAVLVTTRSPYRKATNWGVLSFLIASTISWEQCRFKMRKGIKNTEYAKEHYRSKGNNE